MHRFVPLICSIILLACGPEPFTPLRQESDLVRGQFAAARQAGGTRMVLDILSIETVDDVSVSFSGDRLFFSDAREIRAAVVAGGDRGTELVARQPTSAGLCGSLASGGHACADVLFVPDEIDASERWAVVAGLQSGPEEGAWSIMAGRPVPSGSEPDLVLADMGTE
jgi:hypothetical protein